MLDPILGQEPFELAYAFLASFAFVGVELASSISQYLTWASILGDGVLEDVDRMFGCCFLEFAVAYDQS